MTAGSDDELDASWMEPCVIYPDKEDWTELDDGSVFQSARAGVASAIAEARRRGWEGDTADPPLGGRFKDLELDPLPGTETPAAPPQSAHFQDFAPEPVEPAKGDELGDARLSSDE